MGAFSKEVIQTQTSEFPTGHVARQRRHHKKENYITSRQKEKIGKGGRSLHDSSTQNEYDRKLMSLGHDERFPSEIYWTNRVQVEQNSKISIRTWYKKIAYAFATITVFFPTKIGTKCLRY